MAFTHKQILDTFLVQTKDGNVVSLDREGGSLALVYLQSSVGKDHETVLRAAFFMYQMLHHTQGIINTIVEEMEKVGIDTLTMPLLSSISNIELALKTAREGSGVLTLPKPNQQK